MSTWNFKQNSHLYLAWFWAAMAIPTLLWWKDSILWVATMSLYANFEASMSAHKASKDEANQSKSPQCDRIHVGPHGLPIREVFRLLYLRLRWYTLRALGRAS